MPRVHGAMLVRTYVSMLKIIVLFDPTLMMIMVDLVIVNVETPRIDIGCSLEKEFTKLINPFIILYLIVNQFYSYHGCVHDL